MLRPSVKMNKLLRAMHLYIPKDKQHISAFSILFSAPASAICTSNLAETRYRRLSLSPYVRDCCYYYYIDCYFIIRQCACLHLITKNCLPRPDQVKVKVLTGKCTLITAGLLDNCARGLNFQKCARLFLMRIVGGNCVICMMRVSFFIANKIARICFIYLNCRNIFQ